MDQSENGYSVRKRSPDQSKHGYSVRKCSWSTNLSTAIALENVVVRPIRVQYFNEAAQPHTPSISMRLLTPPQKRGSNGLHNTTSVASKIAAGLEIRNGKTLTNVRIALRRVEHMPL